ncbi:hypothetical protein ZWY2020_018377 [Hordeum vulgare]|nr:hypothetical protein ZWY2020_018377 [Hordeum vulgare]
MPDRGSGGARHPPARSHTACCHRRFVDPAQVGARSPAFTAESGTARKASAPIDPAASFNLHPLFDRNQARQDMPEAPTFTAEADERGVESKLEWGEHQQAS